MLYNLYTFGHEIGICFWTLLSVPVAVLMVIMGLVHWHNQRKREKKYEDRNGNV